ncbi:MAG: NFACT RNA binding domain-containing protein [Longimicrobiales bacterium]
MTNEKATRIGIGSAIRWDALLVRHVAIELRERLTGRRVHALHFDRERLTVRLRCDSMTMAWDLGPSGGSVHVVTSEERLEGNVPVPRPAFVGDVGAPPDERVLTIPFEVERSGESEVAAGGARELVFELISPVWNAIAVGAGGWIVATLRPRPDAARPLAAGVVYEPPHPAARAGATAPISAADWRRIFGGVLPAERRRTLLARVAYTSPLISAHILGAAAPPGAASAGASAPPGANAGARPEPGAEHPAKTASPQGAEVVSGVRRRAFPPAPLPPEPVGESSGGAAAAAPAGDYDRTLDDAFARYHALVGADEMAPCVLAMPHGAQPYPFPLDGMSSEPHSTLLDAFAAAVRARRPHEAEVDSRTAAVPPAVALAGAATAGSTAALESVRRRRQRLDGRISRLRAELEGAATEATALRRQADLLLAQLGRARRGNRVVTLDDLAGGTIDVALDPALSPADNAQCLYDQARKRDRAAQRLPAIMREAEAEAANLDVLAARIEAGTAEPAELEPFTPERRPGRQPVEPRLPYRRYRTTGGLEVRVGRSAAESDELTLHGSAPNDIWLHAREVAGAHVVLRWADRDANPPGADLREAAILAAVHSKARSSATVPVDWTRRKYVRKPRKAKPGRVAIERAKTLFVEPSESLERRLRQ